GTINASAVLAIANALGTNSFSLGGDTFTIGNTSTAGHESPQNNTSVDNRVAGLHGAGIGGPSGKPKPPDKPGDYNFIGPVNLDNMCNDNLACVNNSYDLYLRLERVTFTDPDTLLRGTASAPKSFADLSDGLIGNYGGLVTGLYGSITGRWGAFSCGAFSESLISF